MHELEACLAAHPSLLDDPAKALTESYVKVDQSLAAAKVRRKRYLFRFLPDHTTSPALPSPQDLTYVEREGRAEAKLRVYMTPLFQHRPRRAKTTSSQVLWIILVSLGSRTRQQSKGLAH